MDGVTSAVQTQLNAITANDWVVTARIADDNITNALMADDAIDSAQIADGAIDAVHMSANSVDSAAYVDGSIDEAHMAAESVDEASLYVSNAGSDGQFLAKQSGNNGGLTWTTVVSEDFIPNGSVMCFFQSAAPTGWTKVTTQNDKVLRVVSGTGGGTGGVWATNSGLTSSAESGHTHTVAAHGHATNLAAAAHTLSTSEIPSHNHGSVITGGGNNHSTHSAGGNVMYPVTFSQNSGSTGSTGGGGSHSHNMSGSVTDKAAVATGASTGHTHTITAPAYIDVIICSKDA
jgi:hypothetical protein